MITQIAHLALNVKDMERSLAFYCGGLGFPKAFEIEDDNGNPWIVYLKITDGMFLELFYGGEGENPSTGMATGFNHICLQCDRLHETVEQLREKGVEIDIEPNQGKDKNFQAWIHDPDGNKIELMEIHPDSPQASS